MKKVKIKIDEKNDKVVRWFNGEKWLIKETCMSKKEAKDLETDLNLRESNA